MSISRYYRTGSTNLGAFGKSTYFEYDWWLGADQDTLLLVKPGNYQYEFQQQPDGTYINTTNPAMGGAIIILLTDGTNLLRMKDGSTFTFDQGGKLTALTDSLGNQLTLERYSDLNGGYLKKITTPEGRTVTFNQTYTGNFYRTDSIVDSSGRQVSYTYETDPFSPYPRLKTVTYPDGSSIQYEYDSSGRMSGIIDERGVREVFNEYDTNNRVTTQTHSDGGTHTFNYVTTGGAMTQVSMTAPNGAVTTWNFNSDGYIIDKTTPDGTITYEREAGTNKIPSVTDPLGRITSYTYDTKGRVTTKTDNAGNTTTYEYEDTFSKVTRMIDALGDITTMTYDSYGNMVTQTRPDGTTTSFTYNSFGKPLTVTDAMGNPTSMQYDTSGDLISVTDPLGNTSEMTYDSLGRMSVMTDAKGKSTLYNYDVMGRILDVTDPLGSVTSYGYASDGKLSLVTDALSHDIRYEYDNRSRLIKMTDQLGKIEAYTYDASDNLASMTDRKGQVTAYTYDLMNRITRINYADGTSTSYTYDSGGRLATITDSVSGTISYAYTGTGCGSGCSSMPDKIASETTPLGSISYTYDAIGRRTSMTVAGQPTVNYGYDDNSRLTSVVGAGLASAQISYDALGRRTSLMLPNGVTTNYTYDNSSHLLNMEHKNSAGQIPESLTYTYDAIGNRVSMSRPTVTLPLPNQVSNTSYNESNQMLTFNDKNIIYDANGNMTSVTNACGTTTYTWDVRNRLVGITGFKPDCSALTASFKYDALGRRIEKTINGRTIQYLNDGNDVVQEIEGGVLTVNYIRSLNIDEPLARIDLTTNTVRYYHADALGSVIALSHGTGTIVTQYAYDPFGNVTISGEISDNPFQYTGRENDGTGLYYYRARYYSPELQRFISEDPIRFKGGINFFAYVENDPVNSTDPLGLGNQYRCEIKKTICMEECAQKCNDTTETYINCIGWCQGEGLKACNLSSGKGDFPKNPNCKKCEDEKKNGSK